jgi:hypothetical protein
LRAGTCDCGSAPGRPGPTGPNSSTPRPPELLRQRLQNWNPTTSDHAFHQQVRTGWTLQEWVQALWAQVKDGDRPAVPGLDPDREHLPDDLDDEVYAQVIRALFPGDFLSGWHQDVHPGLLELKFDGVRWWALSGGTSYGDDPNSAVGYLETIAFFGLFDAPADGEEFLDVAGIAATTLATDLAGRLRAALAPVAEAPRCRRGHPAGPGRLRRRRGRPRPNPAAGPAGSPAVGTATQAVARHRRAGTVTADTTQPIRLEKP